MTLDHILNAALQTRNAKAVLLLNEVYVPIAGRGDLAESDVQAISRLLSWTDVDSTGQIPFNDGFLHFHHAESHILALLMNVPVIGSPSSTERAQGPASAVSTSVETLKGRIDLATGSVES